MVKNLIGSIIFSAATLAFAEPMPIFGLPLGGPFTIPTPQCKQKTEPPYTVDALCLRKEWKGKDGSRGLEVQLPESSLPIWAGLGYANLSINPSGILTKVKLSDSTINADDMRRSISLRFGPPTHDFSSYKSPAAWVWIDDGVVITTYAPTRGCCNVTFEVRSEHEARIRRAEQERQKRPATP